MWLLVDEFVFCSCASVCVRAFARCVFSGMSATVYREVPGYSSQFFAYEALKRSLTREGESVADLGAVPLILAGGTAGIFGWCCSYPMDYVKVGCGAQARSRCRSRGRGSERVHSHDR